MATTHQHKRTLIIDGVTREFSESISVNAQLTITEAVPDSSTDLEIACVLDVSEIDSLWIYSDKAVTLETNDGGSAADTIVLAAGVPVQWSVSNDPSRALCPLQTDVTALFATNSSGATANITFIAGYDPTP